MAGIIRVTLRYTLADQDLLNTFYWVGDNPVLADAVILADNFANILESRFEANWTDDLAVGTALINLWQTSPPDPLFPSIPTSVAAVSGAQTGDTLPQGTSLLLNFKAYALPPNRKRLYVGGFCENVNETGLPSAAIIAQGNLAVADLLTTQVVNTHNYLPAVVRLSSLGAYVDHHVLDSGFTSANWARLRSRRSR